MSTDETQDAVRDRGIEAAFPIADSDMFHPEIGLTKRELFAAMAMQGMLSNGGVMVDMTKHSKMLNKTQEELLAKTATLFADALLAALEAR